jgi:hypothetical protein
MPVEAPELESSAERYFVIFVMSETKRDGDKEDICALQLPPITVDLV